MRNGRIVISSLLVSVLGFSALNAMEEGSQKQADKNSPIKQLFILDNNITMSRAATIINKYFEMFRPYGIVYQTELTSKGEVRFKYRFKKIANNPVAMYMAIKDLLNFLDHPNSIPHTYDNKIKDIKQDLQKYKTFVANKILTILNSPIPLIDTYKGTYLRLPRFILSMIGSRLDRQSIINLLGSWSTNTNIVLKELLQTTLDPQHRARINEILDRWRDLSKHYTHYEVIEFSTLENFEKKITEIKEKYGNNLPVYLVINGLETLPEKELQSMREYGKHVPLHFVTTEDRLVSEAGNIEGFKERGSPIDENNLIKIFGLLKESNLLLTGITIGSIDSREKIKLLPELLRDLPHLEMLDLTGTDLTEEWEELAKGLEKLPDLKAINISFGGQGDITPLLDFIQKNKSLEGIVCKGNDLDSLDEFAATLIHNPNLIYLDLSINNIHNLTPLAKALETNPKLKILDLSKNYINDEGAMPLAKALKKNTNLKILNLSRNSLTKEGIDILNAEKGKGLTVIINNQQIKDW
jgi:hypothetical protein